MVVLSRVELAVRLDFGHDGGAESAGLIELRDIALGNPRLVGVYGEDG